MANKEEMSQLTPMDIHNKEFKLRGRNGYDRYEVDSFLDQIVDDYGDALDQIVDLKNKQVSLNEELDKLEDRNEELQKKLAQPKNNLQNVSDLSARKEEIAQFRAKIQNLLNQQIADLNSDEWTEALKMDEPESSVSDSSQDLINNTPTVDKAESNALESSHTHEDVLFTEENKRSEMDTDTSNSGPTIVFPDDYKDHDE